MTAYREPVERRRSVDLRDTAYLVALRLNEARAKAGAEMERRRVPVMERQLDEMRASLPEPMARCAEGRAA